MQVEPEYVEEHFIPLALDSYFRGNSHEVEFCHLAGAGGNHLVVVTAGGRQLGTGEGHRGHVLLRKLELEPLLAEFKGLAEKDRKPTLPDPAKAKPPERPVPTMPENGLVIRGFCTYMKQTPEGAPARAKQYYYKENPNAWVAETQSDMLWLTEKEWRSLIPAQAGPGSAYEVPSEIQRRIFSTLGIDYMEGSVSALPLRESKLMLRPTGSNAHKTQTLEIVGSAKLGKALDTDTKTNDRTRGCEIEVFGEIRYDPNLGNKITGFDLAGLGKAWGNKMGGIRPAIRIAEYPWRYGIYCELVEDSMPYDLVPPYNLLHYGGGMKYFGR